MSSCCGSSTIKVRTGLGYRKAGIQWGGVNGGFPVLASIMRYQTTLSANIPTAMTSSTTIISQNESDLAYSKDLGILLEFLPPQ